MDGPNDVKVLFLQIGDAFQGRDYFNNLDTNLVVKGAKYHIVETVPFNQLKQEGIVKALVSAVKNNATYVYIPTSNSASADNSQSLPAIAAPAFNGPVCIPTLLEIPLDKPPKMPTMHSISLAKRAKN